MNRTRTAYVVTDNAENWGIGWTHEEAVEQAAYWMDESAESVNDELDDPMSPLQIFEITIDASTDIRRLDGDQIGKLAFG